jgi:hypothetical protein
MVGSLFMGANHHKLGRHTNPEDADRGISNYAALLVSQLSLFKWPPGPMVSSLEPA